MNQGYGGPPQQQGYGPPGNVPPPGYAPQPGYPPPQPPSAKKGMGPARIALNVVVAIAFTALAFVGLRQVVLQPKATTAAGTLVTGSPGIGGVLGAAVRSPQVIVDEEMAVSAHGLQARGFTLPAPRPVEVVAEGKTHADKGFTLLVIPAGQVETFEKGGGVQQLAAFEGMKVRTFGHTDTVPAGSWAVVVRNSENILNTMVVHLRIVIDPS